MDLMRVARLFLVGLLWLLSGGMAMLTAFFIVGFISDLRDKSRGHEWIWFWPVLILVCLVCTIGLIISTFIVRGKLM